MAVLLHDDGSMNKIAQTLLEMIRGGLSSVPVDVTVFYPGSEALDPRLAAHLPFAVRPLRDGVRGFAEAARPEGFDYVLLFESSGMYRGEETVPLLAQLATGRLDAVWGSRRLSVRDIEESYRFRYRRKAVAGAISYLGSYFLSLACLVLYGRYITDTLSGVRALRAADALDPRVDLTAKSVNHTLLASLLRRKAEILELPVRFFPLSPDRVKRTSALDGLQALWILLAERLAPARQADRRQDYAGDACAGAPRQMSRPVPGDSCRGPRLTPGREVPKLLVPVGGIPMIDRLERLYKDSRLANRARRPPVVRGCAAAPCQPWGTPAGTCVVQRQPTGMLDAIMLAANPVRAAAGDGVWITWCDQVAVHPATVRTLAVDVGGESGGGPGDPDRSTARTVHPSGDGRRRSHPPSAPSP